MSVTIKDIAEIAGVLYATVSRALNDHSEVSDKTKSKIVHIIVTKKLGKSLSDMPNIIRRVQTS